MCGLVMGLDMAYFILTTFYWSEPGHVVTSICKECWEVIFLPYAQEEETGLVSI